MNAAAIAGAALLLFLGTAADSAAPTQGFDSAVVVKTFDGNGAGVVIESDRVLTAAHVVNGAERMSIEHDGTRYPGEVIAIDQVSDLALITVPELDIAPIPLATDTPSLGQDVWAIGAPGGALSVTRGVVSAVVDLDGIAHIQTDASINQGNSGGPLLDENGTVVGIVVSRSTEFDGVGFAVTPTEIRSFLLHGASAPSEAPRPTDEVDAEEQALPPSVEPDQHLKRAVGVGMALVLLSTGAIAMAIVRHRKNRPVEIFLGRRLPPEQEW